MIFRNITSLRLLVQSVLSTLGAPVYYHYCGVCHFSLRGELLKVPLHPEDRNCCTHTTAATLEEYQPLLVSVLVRLLLDVFFLPASLLVTPLSIEP